MKQTEEVFFLRSDQMIRGWFNMSRSRNPAMPQVSFKEAPTSKPVGVQSIAREDLGIEFYSSKVSVFEDDGVVCVCVGSPTFEDAESSRRAATTNPAAGCRTLYARRGSIFAEQLRGSFAVIVMDTMRNIALLAVDRFSRNGLCFSFRNGRLAFSDRADSLPLERPDIYPQALFDYLYFHVIPTPATVFEGIERVRAGHTIELSASGTRTVMHWRPIFEERKPRPFEELKAEFRSLIDNAVRREATGRQAGCFLSGGTDSSTVAGILSRITGRPAPTFSIGFDADGYDEMAYARLAARHFSAEHHEHYISCEELVAGIPRVAAWYDQPFGNSSAVPAYYCAALAKSNGIDKLLAGDGGDELFGGNTRYATHRVFDSYPAIPRRLRSGLIEPVLLGLPFLRSIPLARKAVSYVTQANVRLPDRLNTYNLLLRLGLEEVLTPAFLNAVDPQAPVHSQRAVWDETSAQALVNRMLVYDWKYTLADNDLPKVCGTAALAEIDVGFPLLNDDLVDFSLRLEPSLKLRGFKLRYFFKEALRDFLPPEIIAKKKHGFGLPFGLWLTRHSGLQALVRESFDTLSRRGLIKSNFLHDLLARRLAEHPGYYGEMVWLLLILEQWFAVRAPRFSLS
jgi:asparagine synthase (glutamine-hydrolysing)